MRDFLNLTTKLGIRRKYIFLLILRAPFDAFRTWMLSCLMRTAFLCVETGDSDKLLTKCIIYGLICVLLFFYNGTIWSIYAAFAARMEVRLQKMLFNKMINMPYKQIGSHSGGEWITRLNSDIHGAFVLMNGPFNIPHAVVSVLNIALSSVLLVRCSFTLFLSICLFVFPHLYLNYKLAGKQMPELKEESQKALAESTSSIKPLITEADTILLYGAGDLMMKHCEESSRKLMKVNLSIHMRNALSSAALRLFGAAGYLVILVVGYNIIYNGIMSFSELVYFLQARGSVLAGLLMLTTCVNNIKANSACIKRIHEMEGAYEK